MFSFQVTAPIGVYCGEKVCSPADLKQLQFRDEDHSRRIGQSGAWSTCARIVMAHASLTGNSVGQHTATANIAVVIPTYNRGDRVCHTIEKILCCDPPPAEIWVHVDRSDGRLESILAQRFPKVNVISSAIRQGPGGGRHRCLVRCSASYAMSFDDDSWPMDPDFFRRFVEMFEERPEAAVIEAAIRQRNQEELQPSSALVETLTYTGCGHGIRMADYRAIRGYVPRAVAYGLEEVDVALQLFAIGKKIYRSSQVTVFHDTELAHHSTPEITAGVVVNAAMLAWLRYPVWLWPWGLLQIGSMVAYMVSVGRWRGVTTGLARSPIDCYEFRRYRQVLPARAVIGYLRARKAPAQQVVSA